MGVYARKRLNRDKGSAFEVIDFSNIQGITLPEGKASKIMRKSDGVVLWRQGRLPSAYQEVQYIYMPTNAYINTGFIPADDTTLYAKVMPLAESAIFGSGSNPRISVSLSADGGTLTINNPTNSVSGILSVGYTPNTIAEIETYTSADYVSNTVNGTNYGEYGPDVGYYWQIGYTLPLYLGAWNYNASTLRTGAQNWYAFHAKIGNTLHLDLVPCYRKADNVVGMYDLISKTFYTNAGSGSFTKGPNA